MTIAHIWGPLVRLGNHVSGVPGLWAFVALPEILPGHQRFGQQYGGRSSGGRRFRVSRVKANGFLLESNLWGGFTFLLIWGLSWDGPNFTFCVASCCFSACEPRIGHPPRWAVVLKQGLRAIPRSLPPFPECRAFWTFHFAVSLSCYVKGWIKLLCGRRSLDLGICQWRLNMFSTGNAGIARPLFAYANRVGKCWQD